MSGQLPELFSFPAGRRSFSIREEFIGICAFSPSPHCAGAILSVIDRWTRYRMEERHKTIRENEQRSKRGQALETLPDFWVFMSGEQFSREMLYMFGERTIRESLAWLRKNHFLARRSNPNNAFDKVYQYRLMRTRVQYAIDLYAEFNLRFDGNISPSRRIQKHRPEAAKLPLRGGKNSQTPQSLSQEAESQIPVTEEEESAAAKTETQESTPVEEDHSGDPAQAAQDPPTPGSADPLPPIVLEGLGMRGAANVARQERQAADFRKVKAHALYQAFVAEWEESLSSTPEAQRDAIIPHVRPENAARHLDALAQLDLMGAKASHVRTVVAAKREAGKSEYPFTWLPSDVQKLIVAEQDALAEHARATENVQDSRSADQPDTPAAIPIDIELPPPPTWRDVAATSAEVQLARLARRELEQRAAFEIARRGAPAEAVEPEKVGL